MSSLERVEFDVYFEEGGFFRTISAEEMGEVLAHNPPIAEPWPHQLNYMGTNAWFVCRLKKFWLWYVIKRFLYSFLE